MGSDIRTVLYETLLRFLMYHASSARYIIDTRLVYIFKGNKVHVFILNIFLNQYVVEFSQRSLSSMLHGDRMCVFRPFSDAIYVRHSFLIRDE